MRRSKDQRVVSRAARYIVRGVTRILCESTSPPSPSLFSFFFLSSFFFYIFVPSFSFFLPSFLLSFLPSFLLLLHTSSSLTSCEKNHSTECILWVTVTDGGEKRGYVSNFLSNCCSGPSPLHFRVQTYSCKEETRMLRVHICLFVRIHAQPL